MAKKTRSLHGKVAIVTGSARGAGRAEASALAQRGVKVVLVDLDKDLVKQAAEDIGGDAIGVPLDVTDHAAFHTLFDTVEAQFGQVDILINNAGIMPIGPFDQESDATAERIIEINFHAVLWSTKEAIRRWKRQGRGGHIVNIASGAAWIASGGGASYTGSKYAVLGFSHAVSLELRGSGIDISVVAPSFILTELGAGLADVKGFKKITPEDVAAAVISGLEKPRFVIFVPRLLGAMSLAISAMPYPVRDFLARVSKTDNFLLGADMKARAAYEHRVVG